VTGGPELPPQVGTSVADMCATVYATSAIIAASGTFIDISMVGCLSEWMMAPAYH
jgi:itaconate CoA-transferase